MYSWERKLIDEAQKYGYIKEDKKVPETILKQLGGNKFLAMTGARALTGGSDFLSFKLPGAYNGINYVKITLTASDHYDVEFGFIGGKSYANQTYSVKKQAHGIYADQLQKLFTATTGLYTHL